MALVKVKPTSAGRRGLVKVVNDKLHKGKPYAGLLEKKIRSSGRNNSGRITTRHMGGGHKQHYRIVDFKRAKDGVPAKVERLEYDPNRSAHIALLVLLRRRAPLHRRAEGPDGRRAADERQRSADPCRQYAAAAEHSGRHHYALRRDAAGQGRTAGARGRHCRCSCWRAKGPTRSCGCVRARSAVC